MTEEETWAFLEASINGTLTTLRRDGRPVALPVWFVVLDGRIYISTRGKKLKRLRNDSRCSFLVEAGERWAELRAVHLECDGVVLDPVPGELAERIAGAMADKYAAYRTASTDMPKATRDAYQRAAGGIVELRVTGKVLTWDNRRLYAS
jgi:hypothetical protein